MIMVDAYQDITIPFQMSSVEFFTLVRDHLAPGGVIAVEHGCEQGEAVRKILSAALEKADAEAEASVEDRTISGTKVITIKDYGNNDRVTCGRGEK